MIRERYFFAEIEEILGKVDAGKAEAACHEYHFSDPPSSVVVRRSQALSVIK
jgi:hypothetical protein